MTTRLVCLVLLAAACGSKKADAPAADKPAGDKPAPAATPPATAPTPPATGGATVTMPVVTDPAPAPAQPTLNATQRAVGILNKHHDAFDACLPATAGSTMINLHVAADGAVTFDLWSKTELGADVKACVAKELATLTFTAEKVDVAVDI